MPAPRLCWTPRIALIFVSLLIPAQKIDLRAVDAAVESSRKAWQSPGVALAIVHNDQVVHLKGYGVRRTGEPQAITPDTLFAIASTTKAFTTGAMAILNDEGKMNWDDPVRQHLPGFHFSDPLADRDVTMRDLVTHRTGLSRHDMLWIGSPWSRKELLERIGRVPLTKSFRSAYQYQNLMFTAAGEAVGAAAGSTWEDFVSRRILQPLEMKSTCFSVKDAQAAADHASVHTKTNGAIRVGDWSNVDNIGGAGCLNSNVRELANWVRMQLADGVYNGRRVISEKNVREMHTPQTVIRLEGETLDLNPETTQSSYGLGWSISTYRGEHVVSHGGSLRGFRSQVVLLPRRDLGFVILSNLGNTQLPEALRNRLIDRFLELPARDWDGILLAAVEKQDAEKENKKRERLSKRHEGTKPSRELAAYAGRYDNPAYGVAEVGLTAQGLELKWSNFRARLTHFHFDTFDLDGGGSLDGEVTFQLNGAGDIRALRMLDMDFARK